MGSRHGKDGTRLGHHEGLVAAVGGGLTASAGIIPFAVVFGGTMVLFVVLFGFLEALTVVFQTALYRWTQDLPTGPAFSDQQLHAAFDLR